MKKPTVAALYLALTTPLAFAQNLAQPPKVVTVPPQAETSAQAADDQPDVVIVDTPQGKVQEYRVRGRLYMVKVIPQRGYPYYLVDRDGDGFMESRRNDAVDPPVWVHQWMLYQW